MKNLLFKISIGLLMIICSCTEDNPSKDQPHIGRLIFQIYDEDGDLFIPKNEGYNYESIEISPVFSGWTETFNWCGDSIISTSRRELEYFLAYGNGDIDTIRLEPVYSEDPKTGLATYPLPEILKVYFNDVLQTEVQYDDSDRYAFENVNTGIFHPRYDCDVIRQEDIRIFGADSFIFDLIKVQP